MIVGDLRSRKTSVAVNDIENEGVQGRSARQRKTVASKVRYGPIPWLVPSLIALLLVSSVPIVMSFVNSFRVYNLGMSPDPGAFIGWGNYVNALTNTGFAQALSRTFLFALIVTSVELVLGVLIALLLRARLVGAGLVRSVLIMPVAIAPTIAGLAFRSMYADTGLITVLLRKVGIQLPAEGVLGSTATAFPALMLTDIWQWTPFVAIISLAAIQGVPRDVLEAGRLDGAGSVRIVWSLTLPLITGALTTVAILRFVQSFNVFDIVYVMTRGGPGGSTSTAGMEIFLAGLNNYNIGLASAMTVMATVIVAAVVTGYVLLSNSRREVSIR